MLDRDSILWRFSMIEQCLKTLERVKLGGLTQYLSDFELRLKAERALHIAIESCVDISNHLIAVRGFRKPTDYADVFRALREEGILSADLTERLVNMIRFRHRLVHIYSKLDHALVFSYITDDLDDIREFVSTINTQLG